MSNPYIASREWFGDYRKYARNYNYHHAQPWPDDNPIRQTLARGEAIPYRRWVDHPVLEADPRTGKPVYVCHPYHLDTGALADFLALERAGFRVTVSGASPYHPNALRVTITDNR